MARAAHSLSPALLPSADPAQSTSIPTGLPPGWEVRHSNSKNLPYYFAPASKESRWEPPPGTDASLLKHYMSVHHSTSSSSGSAPSATTAAASTDGSKIRAAHLLIKYAGSRRPSSWREAQVTRSHADALAVLQAHEARISAGEAALGDVAVTESDCISARKRGDLGFFGRGDMQREFEEAAFALKPGEVSGIVETASGLHLIER